MRHQHRLPSALHCEAKEVFGKVVGEDVAALSLGGASAFAANVEVKGGNVFLAKVLNRQANGFVLFGVSIVRTLPLILILVTDFLFVLSPAFAACSAGKLENWDGSCVRVVTRHAAEMYCLRNPDARESGAEDEHLLSIRACANRIMRPNR